MAWPSQSAHAYVYDDSPANPPSVRGIGSATATISFASHSVECQVDDHQKIGAVFPFPPSTRPTLKYSLHSTSPRLEPRAGREEADRVHPQFHDSPFQATPLLVRITRADDRQQDRLSVDWAPRPRHRAGKPPRPKGRLLTMPSSATTLLT
jgi:hypothetical protein